MPTVAERLGVAAFLLAVFFLQLWTAFHLNALQAFDQYNLFFEADSIDYLSAVANGWSFTRYIHPGVRAVPECPNSRRRRSRDGSGHHSGRGNPQCVGARAVAAVRAARKCFSVAGMRPRPALRSGAYRCRGAPAGQRPSFSHSTSFSTRSGVGKCFYTASTGWHSWCLRLLRESIEAAESVAGWSWLSGFLSGCTALGASPR